MNEASIFQLHCRRSCPYDIFSSFLCTCLISWQKYVSVAEILHHYFLVAIVGVDAVTCCAVYHNVLRKSNNCNQVIDKFSLLQENSIGLSCFIVNNIIIIKQTFYVQIDSILVNNFSWRWEIINCNHNEWSIYICF